MSSSNFLKSFSSVHEANKRKEREERKLRFKEARKLKAKEVNEECGGVGRKTTIHEANKRKEREERKLRFKEARKLKAKEVNEECGGVGRKTTNFDEIMKLPFLEDRIFYLDKLLNNEVRLKDLINEGDVTEKVLERKKVVTWGRILCMNIRKEEREERSCGDFEESLETKELAVERDV
ncbi:hypothetical protein Glove_19g41 [Diversispora epigaea]|uniref:Uncharacterized protein n=1 Tax=Diversispora epigaea TaxID=1348612 RepID=A0A397JQ53_9GLOM|nr:hypothetical protein Glove_19g41 [Diversispora epigaea]